MPCALMSVRSRFPAEEPDRKQEPGEHPATHHEHVGPAERAAKEPRRHAARVAGQSARRGCDLLP
jgi:hypothetical protein